MSAHLSWPAGRRLGRRFQRQALAGLAIVLALALLAGFGWYVVGIEAPAPLPGDADGIAVLTGGADRVRAGLKLLEEGRAPTLLVSGIGGDASFGALAREAGVNARALAPRVTLGRGATTTRGNAAEIAAWARERGLRSLIVVTASYHMPRALTEIRRDLPGAALAPAPVETPAGVRLLLGEYLKLAAARLDLTALLPVSEPRLTAARKPGALP